ncbi:ABC transporter ATP-binding protein [Ferrovibrio xuzhouensis]|uniref:ABC transporter ATP-binding protein n=1 Tax=Ferrovibrio xuzhouensis TaxID=1576914 RepID=A0ABV7VLE5_9PROT
MVSDVVVRAENVSKHYRLGVINHGTLYRDMQSWYARLRGRPDPNVSVSDLSTAKSRSLRMRGERFMALDDISFELRQGEVTGIIGRNGAGKSTLLKVISRITAPSSGHIRLKGRVASLLEVGTGFHPELTGRENVYLNGAILGMSQREVASKFEQIVEFAEIGEFIDTPVKRYSSGMYVRLAFSVAAHLEPEILLVDEVLAVGDANFQKKCLGRMHQVGKDGRTILFVSHNMTAINNLCPKTIYIEDGRVAAIGETASVVQEYLARGESGVNGTHDLVPEELEGKAVIYKVSVLDAKGEPSSRINLVESFAIEIEYELRERLSGLSVGLQIMGEDGFTCIFSLSDPELEPSRLEARMPGRYRAIVRFPPAALNTGSFYIRAGISSRFSIYSVVENLRFEVHDNVGIIQMLGQSRKPSISALQLPWEVERI